jgi:hypothetical protein
MDDFTRSRKDLLAELEELRQRVAALEKQRNTTVSVLHGDPVRRTAPLVSRVPALVWTTDTRMRLTWWTGGAVQQLATDPDELIGMDIPTYFGFDDPEFPPIAAHVKALQGKSASYEVEAADGVTMSSHVQPLRDAGGAIQGVIGVAIDISRRCAAERQREELIGELREALDRVKVLSGLIPICMHCKNVRNDGGYWEQVETYVHDHSDAEFTHAICPECMEHSLRRAEGSSPTSDAPVPPKTPRSPR